MSIPETLLEIMKKDGVVAIATLGKDGPHMVNTWNSYLRISADGRLFIPAGYMHKTEANIRPPDLVRFFSNPTASSTGSWPKKSMCW